MIVVDTNIIVYLYVETEYSKHAESLYRRDSDWAVPLLWRSEFRNVLAQLIKKDKLRLDHALHIFYEARQIVSGKEFQSDTEGVLELAVESGCSAYDGEFVRLAQYFDTKLITMDKKLLSSFPRHTRKLTAAAH